MMYVPLVHDHKQSHSWRYQGKKADSAGSGDGDDDDGGKGEKKHKNYKHLIKAVPGTSFVLHPTL